MSKPVIVILATLLLVLSLSVWAGENKYLGAIVSPDGGSFNNTTTATPFLINNGIKVTMDCDAAARVLTDASATALTGSTKGVRVALTTLFPTSVGKFLTTVTSTDGGLAGPTSLIAIIPVSGGATCDVWARLGTE